MSKQSYRSRRNRRNPEAGSLGAPFRGLYALGISNVGAVEGTISLFAYKLKNDLSATERIYPWEVGQILNLDDVCAIFVDGVGAPLIDVSVVTTGRISLTTNSFVGFTTLEVYVKGGSRELQLGSGEAVSEANVLYRI